MHSCSLASYVRRVAAVLGFQALPSVAASDIVFQAVRRLLRELSPSSFETVELEEALPTTHHAPQNDSTGELLADLPCNSSFSCSSSQGVGQQPLTTLEHFDNSEDIFTITEELLRLSCSDGTVFCDQDASLPTTALLDQLLSETYAASAAAEDEFQHPDATPRREQETKQPDLFELFASSGSSTPQRVPVTDSCIIQPDNPAPLISKPQRRQYPRKRGIHYQRPRVVSERNYCATVNALLNVVFSATQLNTSKPIASPSSTTWNQLRHLEVSSKVMTSIKY